MLRTLLLVLLSVGLFMPISVRAQDAYLELYSRHAQARTYVDSVVLPSEVGSTALFVVRIPNSRLVFVREREPLTGAPFVARVEITVQVRNGEEIVRERIWQSDHAVDSYDVSTSRDEDFQARVPIELPDGAYSYRVQVRDLNASDVVVARADRLTVPHLDRGEAGIPIAVEAVPQPGDALVLANLGGDVPYEQPGAFLIPVRWTRSEGEAPPTLEYAVWKLASDGGMAPRRTPRSAPRTEWALPEAKDVDVEGAARVTQSIVPFGHWIPFDLAEQPLLAENRAHVALRGGETGYFLVPVVLESVAERTGSFALEVRVAGADAGTLYPFSFHWKDMPIALYDAGTAIRLLSWIEEPARIRELLRGSRLEREEAILSYWNERDPTPGTAYNELMAEYYRRIDHAALAFRTGGGPLPNGLRTDQARIYIVHGPPQAVDRTFPDSGGVEETWSYPNGRRFVFWAASSLDPLALIEPSGR